MDVIEDFASARHKKIERMRLKCNGTGRDKDHDRALQFYFNRRVTDDELRFLNEVIKRAVACIPEGETP